MIEITLNDQKVQVEEGSTILDAAKKIGVEIPALCHHPDVILYGACRLCTVEIHDGRKTRMVTACNYPIRKPITVNTDSEKTISTRKTLIRMMLSRWPNVTYIKEIAKKYKVENPDYTHPLVDSNENACILCGLCVRICEQDGAYEEGIMGYTGRGSSRSVAVNMPYKEHPDKCPECNKCAAICPTWNIIIPTEFVKIQNKITDAIESGSKSIPDIAKATGLPSHIVTYNLMSSTKFGQIAVGDVDEDDEYYYYKLPKNQKK